MGFNLTTDDVWDERERLGLNKKTKIKPIHQVFNDKGKLILEGNTSFLSGKVQKHFGLTARWSKRGRWRQVLKDNNYTITKKEVLN